MSKREKFFLIIIIILIVLLIGIITLYFNLRANAQYTLDQLLKKNEEITELYHRISDLEQTINTDI